MLLRSLRHDSVKKDIVLLLLLRSLRHDYNKKANYFSFQHYFHYTVIRRIKYCFNIATTFTTPWPRQKINLFSFQHYPHYKVLEIQEIQWSLGIFLEIQEIQWSLGIFFLRKFSVFKRFVHDTLVSSSGTSVESYMLYYPKFQWRVLVFFFLRKFSVFKRFVHDALVSSSGTSVESCMLYYPIVFLWTDFVIVW